MRQRVAACCGASGWLVNGMQGVRGSNPLSSTRHNSAGQSPCRVRRQHVASCPDPGMCRSFLLRGGAAGSPYRLAGSVLVVHSLSLQAWPTGLGAQGAGGEGGCASGPGAAAAPRPSSRMPPPWPSGFGSPRRPPALPMLPRPPQPPLRSWKSRKRPHIVAEHAGAEGRSSGGARLPASADELLGDLGLALQPSKLWRPMHRHTGSRFQPPAHHGDQLPVAR